MAAGEQACSQRLIVVDLAVEDDMDRAVLVRHGLMATSHIDDAEPAHADRHARRDMIPAVVGSSVPNGVAHPAESIRRVGSIRQTTGEAGYSTHRTSIGSMIAVGSPMRVERPAEHELVAADGTATGRHVDHLQTVATAELKNLLRLRDLERIPAEPIEPIIEDGHAAARSVLGVPLERIPPPEDVGSEFTSHHRRDVRRAHDRLPEGPRTIEALERRPPLGPRALVVIDRDRECTAGCNETCRVL